MPPQFAIRVYFFNKIWGYAYLFLLTLGGRTDFHAYSLNVLKELNEMCVGFKRLSSFTLRHYHPIAFRSFSWFSNDVL